MWKTLLKPGSACGKCLSDGSLRDHGYCGQPGNFNSFADLRSFPKGFRAALSADRLRQEDEFSGAHRFTSVTAEDLPYPEP